VKWNIPKKVYVNLLDVESIDTGWVQNVRNLLIATSHTLEARQILLFAALYLLGVIFYRLFFSIRVIVLEQLSTEWNGSVFALPSSCQSFHLVLISPPSHRSRWERYYVV